MNDLDAHIPNFWRAMQADPEGLAAACDAPAFEVDLHAWHLWLKAPDRKAGFVERLMADPGYYDLTRAARWCWGLCLWIGGSWCSPTKGGPWGVSLDDEGYPSFQRTDAAQGISRKRPQVGHAGHGVHRKRPHLGDAGQGVHRKLPHLGDAGQGVHRPGAHLLPWFRALQARLRRVRACCGDWSRICGPSVTVKMGLTGVYLDPPYALEEDRCMVLYAHDSATVAHDVREWCLKHGRHPLLRIVLSGYEGTHDALLAHGWRTYHWATQGGMGNQGQGRGRTNKLRETLWCSPQCLSPLQLPLF